LLKIHELEETKNTTSVKFFTWLLLDSFALIDPKNPPNWSISQIDKTRTGNADKTVKKDSMH